MTMNRFLQKALWHEFYVS